MKFNKANSKKLRYGGVTAVLTALIIVAVLIVNVIFSALAQKLIWYKDLTPELLFTLSDNCVDLLKNGGADNNIEIVIRLTWDTDQGTGSQDFKFTDEVVGSVYSSNQGAWNKYSKMFSMVVTGFESIENLKANIIVVSGTDAEYVSSTSVDIT